MAKGIVGPTGSARIPLKPFKQLPKRKRDFVHKYVQTGDAQAAYAAAGYKPSPPGAYRLHREMQPYIGQELTKYVKGTEMAIVGLKIIREMAEGSQNEMVRFNAAKELVSRALPDDPKEVLHVHQKAELTDDQLLKRIEELRNKLVPTTNDNVVKINESQRTVKDVN